jgi:transcriptional regulator with XRE-family HTH domain
MLTYVGRWVYTKTMDDIGKRLRSRRLECNMTMKELAEKCKVTSSLISQIENGKIHPSLSTLSKITRELDYTVGQVVDGEQPSKAQLNHSSIVRFKNRKALDDPNLDLTMYILSEQVPFKMMETLIFTFHKETKDNGFRFQHFGQEFALVLKGSIKIILGKEQYHLSKGDSIYFESSIPHIFINTQEKTTEVLSINTPQSF